MSIISKRHRKIATAIAGRIGKAAEVVNRDPVKARRWPTNLQAG